MSPRPQVGLSPRGGGALGAAGGGSLFKRRVVSDEQGRDGAAENKGLISGLGVSTKTSGQDPVQQDSEKEQARKHRFEQAQAALEESKAALSRLSLETQGSETGLADDLASAFLQGLQASPAAVSKLPPPDADVSLEESPSTDPRLSTPNAVALLRCDLPRKVAQNESQDKSPGKIKHSRESSPIPSRQSPEKGRQTSPDAGRTKLPDKVSLPVDQALLAGALPCSALLVPKVGSARMHVREHKARACNFGGTGDTPVAVGQLFF